MALLSVTSLIAVILSSIGLVHCIVVTSLYKSSQCGLSVCEVNTRFTEDLKAIVEKIDYLIQFEFKVMNLESKLSSLIDRVDGLNEGEVLYTLKTLNERVQSIENELKRERVVNEKVEPDLLKKKRKMDDTNGAGGSIVGRKIPDEGEIIHFLPEIQSKVSSYDVRLENLEYVSEILNESVRLLNSTVEQRHLAMDFEMNKQERKLSHLDKNVTQIQDKLDETKVLINDSIIRNERNIEKVMENKTNLLHNLIDQRDEIWKIKFQQLQNDFKELNAFQTKFYNEFHEYVDANTNSSAYSTELNKTEDYCHHQLPSDSNFFVSVDGKNLSESMFLPHGTVVHYQCKDSTLILHGENNVTCLNGKWSNREPYCETTHLETKFEDPCESPNGDFKNPRNCSTFYKCSEGHPTVLVHCTPKTYYHQDAGRCLWTEPEDCYN